MKKFFEGIMKQTWFKILIVVIVVTAVALLYYKFGDKTVSRMPQEILIESKGLAEFNPENNATQSYSKEDKKVAEDIMPVLKLMGDGKDNKKNQDAINGLKKVISKYPEYSDAYFLRATISVLVGDNDYQKIIADIDSAIKYHSSVKYQSSYDSTAGMYALRAKVDLLSGNYQQAMNDLETTLKNNPDKDSDVFSTGGVKPEDDSNKTALQKKDFDLLVEKFSDDYRPYMFRGLFYNNFSFYDIQYYKPVVDDLKMAISLNPNSSLAYYFLGTVYQKIAYHIYSFKLDGGTTAYDNARDSMNAKALDNFKESAKDLLFKQAQAMVAQSFYSLERYSEAIPYYDRVVVLDPNDAGAYNDRGLAKTYTSNFYSAISDFSKAIDIKKANHQTMDNVFNISSTYENRASAYAKTDNYDSAIADYSRAIGLIFGQETISMPVSQVKDIYPELKDIPDQDLIEGLRQKYYPNLASKDFLDLLNKNKPTTGSTSLADISVFGFTSH